MPEGPEVRIIVDQLNDRVVGKVFSAFEVVGGRYAHAPDASFDKIPAHLPLKVNSVKCKGKFIYWEFEQEWYLWNTLGMTGGWSINTHTPHKTVKLRLDQDDYYFNDVRHFGTVKFVKSKNLLQHRLATLGPDVLESPPSQEKFHKSIVGSSKTLAEWLINQAIDVKSEFNSVTKRWHPEIKLKSENKLTLLKQKCNMLNKRGV